MSNASFVDLHVQAESEGALTNVIFQLGVDAAIEEFSSHKEAINPFSTIHYYSDIWALGYEHASKDVESQMSDTPSRLEFELYTQQANNALYEELQAA